MTNPKFRIEQLALGFPSSDSRGSHSKALAFLARCGITEWVSDTVEATGTVEGRCMHNKADLKFNYSAFGGKELELLRYKEGPNWLTEKFGVSGSNPVVSHIGMHCDEADLMFWRRLMAEFDIDLAQEVWTDSHTNPRIRGCRRYHYVIFSTHHLIGVDMKFIVRTITNPDEEARQVAQEQERQAMLAEAGAATLTVKPANYEHEG